MPSSQRHPTKNGSMLDLPSVIKLVFSAALAYWAGRAIGGETGARIGLILSLVLNIVALFFRHILDK